MIIKGNNRLVSKSITRLIPSNPKSKFTLRKLIQLTEYPFDGMLNTRLNVKIKFKIDEISATGFTKAEFLISRSKRPVINGMRRITRSTIFSDCQYKDDK
jgi:hypothetical protein